MESYASFIKLLVVMQHVYLQNYHFITFCDARISKNHVNQTHLEHPQ